MRLDLGAGGEEGKVHLNVRSLTVRLGPGRAGAGGRGTRRGGAPELVDSEKAQLQAASGRAGGGAWEPWVRTRTPEEEEWPE